MFLHKKLAHRNIALSNFYERHQKFVPKVLRSWLGQKVAYGISPNAYDLYMSLGENCLPARTLKEVNLRKFSGPFDWVAKSDFAMRIAYVESNFENFLNYDDLRFEVDTKGDSRSCYVQNMRTGFYHPHDFQDDSQECYLKQKAKYERRQKRFYSLSKDTNALFIYSDVGTKYYHADYLPKLDDFFASLQRLQEKLKTKKISLILMVKANSEIDSDFVDLYEKGPFRLFIQPVPSKFVNDYSFDNLGIFLKRALRIATDYELKR